MRALLIALIRVYQALLAPWVPPRVPVSAHLLQYAVEALRRHGVWRGGRMAAARLLRCRPGGGGGEDPVP